MKKIRKIVLAFTLVAILSASGVTVLADEADEAGDAGNGVSTLTTTCITQAIHIEGSKDVEYRYSSTGIWLDEDYIYGGHQSESTINEDEIWADGGIKRSGQGWADMDSHRTSGFIAYCDTSMQNPAGTQAFIAHTWHYYNDSLGGELAQQSEVTCDA